MHGSKHCDIKKEARLAAGFFVFRSRSLEGNASCQTEDPRTLQLEDIVARSVASVQLPIKARLALKNRSLVRDVEHVEADVDTEAPELDLFAETEVELFLDRKPLAVDSVDQDVLTSLTVAVVDAVIVGNREPLSGVDRYPECRREWELNE